LPILALEKLDVCREALVRRSLGWTIVHSLISGQKVGNAGDLPAEDPFL
jgi:hypothetical protein